MPSTGSSTYSVRSTTNKQQPSCNIDRFLATSARAAPYVAGNGTRQRCNNLNNELDYLLSKLELADRARGAK